MAAFLEKAQNEAAEIDTDLLWETCGEEEFTAAAAAEEYFGHAPSKTELAATLIALYAAPMYFYKKAKGVFKAAPEETLKQALAAIERKKQQEALMEEWTGRLKQALELVDVRLLDHFIVTARQAVSLAEQGLL